MIAIDRSASPSVCDCVGDRFRVQLRYTALRSEKSQRESAHNSSCVEVSEVMT